MLKHLEKTYKGIPLKIDMDISDNQDQELVIVRITCYCYHLESIDNRNLFINFLEEITIEEISNTNKDAKKIHSQIDFLKPHELGMTIEYSI